MDGIFSIWNINKDEVTQFIKQANSHHPTIKFTAEVSDTETFLDKKFTKAKDLQNMQSRLDIKTHSVSKLLKHFIKRISQVATHQRSKRVSSKAKHSDFSEPGNSSETAFKLLFHNLKQISSEEGTQKLSFQQQKLHLRRENLPYNRNVNKARESCLLSHNIAHQCLT